jgi:acyl carrier protein phosphodiesterase
MNHLAHSILSFPNPQVLLGNFIGDFVKGRAWEAYPPEIRKGILLHRSIDAFTDAHPAVRESVRRLRPLAGRYSGPLADVLYDHLLVRQWGEMTDVGFNEYAGWVYATLDAQQGWMPAVLQERWPRMLDARFLHGYADAAGLRFVLDRFSRRLEGSFDSETVHRFFFEQIEAFDADFRVFFPALKLHLEGLDHSDKSI